MAWTEEDEFNPLYCPRCKRHVPRAQLAQHPYCPKCLAQLEQEQQRAARQEAYQKAVEQQRQEAQWRQVYEADTGMGACPQCGSRNIQQFATGGTDTTAQAATCCAGCLFFWPLMLLAPFLFRRPTQLHRSCNACGYAWQV